jgi:hypothetical protein
VINSAHFSMDHSILQVFMISSFTNTGRSLSPMYALDSPAIAAARQSNMRLRQSSDIAEGQAGQRSCKRLIECDAPLCESPSHELYEPVEFAHDRGGLKDRE